MAQSILVCYFCHGAAEDHRQLLAQLVQECDDVQRGEMSQNVRSKAFNRLKVAKDIFRSKLSQKVVDQSQLKA